MRKQSFEYVAPVFNTEEEFAEWCVNGNFIARRDFFDWLQWPEGLVYCYDREYARATGYTAYLKLEMQFKLKNKA